MSKKLWLKLAIGANKEAARSADPTALSGANDSTSADLTTTPYNDIALLENVTA